MNTEIELNVPELRKSYVEYELNNLPEIFGEWFSTDYITESLNAHWEFVFGAAAKENSGRALAERMNIAGTNYEDFRWHLIELSNDRFLISSIRFAIEEDNVTPYIQVYEKNFSLFSIGSSDLHMIIDRYKMFYPHYLRFFDYTEISKTSLNGWNVKMDSIEIIGHITLMKSLPHPKRYDEVAIRLIGTMDFYKQYSDEYDEFRNLSPENRSFVNKEKYSTLERLMTGGGLYGIYIDGEIAGVMGVEKGNAKPFAHLVVVEKVLFKKYRSLGYGAAFQKKVIDMLKTTDSELLFGTVHPGNKASLKTALVCGRELTGYNYLIMLTK